MQNWLQANCSGFTDSPELTGLAHLDYYVWGAKLEKYHKLQPKPRTTDELKADLQTIWEELPQEHVNKAVANFLTA